MVRERPPSGHKRFSQWSLLYTAIMGGGNKAYILVSYGTRADRLLRRVPRFHALLYLCVIHIKGQCAICGIDDDGVAVMHSGYQN